MLTQELQQRYLELVSQLGCRERILHPVAVRAKNDTARPRAALVLIGGWCDRFGDWPGCVLLFCEGDHRVGHRLDGLGDELPVKLFEGTQCALRVGERFELIADHSTNGTLVVSSAQAKSFTVPDGPIDDTLAARYAPTLPQRLQYGDLLLTNYACFAVLDAP